MASKTAALLSIAYFMAVTVCGISAQVYNLQDFNPYQQQQRQPQQPQQVQPQLNYQQYLQQLQEQPQPQQQYQYNQPQPAQPQQPYTKPGKVTGYEPQDLIPKVESPLNDLDKSQGNPQYVDFINKLYRFDRSKPALQNNSRQKRALIFRPLFVYRQQKARKEKIAAQKQPEKAAVQANKSQLYKDKDNHVYQEYNSYYDPYRYGQRYPYRNY